MRSDEALPGMQTQPDWVHNSLGTGEMLSRNGWPSWLKLKDLEARVAKLETA
jgi:hypothetical protein